MSEVDKDGRVAQRLGDMHVLLGMSIEESLIEASWIGVTKGMTLSVDGTRHVVDGATDPGEDLGGVTLNLRKVENDE